MEEAEELKDLTDPIDSSLTDTSFDTSLDTGLDPWADATGTAPIDKHSDLLKELTNFDPITTAIFNKAVVKARFPRQRIKPFVISKPDQERIVKQAQKQEVTPKVDEIIEEDTITIPDVILTVASAAALTTIITRLLTQVGGTKFIESGGKRFLVPTAPTKAGYAALAKRLFARFKRKRFVFLPDMYSLIFGIKARPKQRIKLLKVGRIFTGLERRPVIAR